MDNQLHTKLIDLNLPEKLAIPKSSNCKLTDELIDIIETLRR